MMNILLTLLLLLILVIVSYLIITQYNQKLILGGGNKSVSHSKIKDTMDIFIVRHGQTDSNKSNVVNEYDTPLNEIGREEAIKAGKHLAKESFDCAYVSPMLRASQTADLIIEQLSNKPGIVHDKRLEEIDRGTISAEDIANSDSTYRRIVAEHKEKYPEMKDFFDHINEYDEQMSEHYEYEKMHETKARVKEFLRDLRKSKHKKVLIVSHGGFIRQILSYMKNTPEYELKTRITNCSITHIADDGKTYREVSFHD